ncbi:alkaline phosphatase D family protein [Ramlibacter sp. AN1133]|uniref:alkaline phosphatase D family protein n=1 Tax=Ramlibacter sp. AN1133 TaxID=3133429 RepID=UPI0030BEB74C
MTEEKLDRSIARANASTTANAAVDPPSGDYAGLAVAEFSRRRFVIGAGSALALASTFGLGACGGGGDVDEDPFGYGVASGDPLPDRVIIWTRANRLSEAVQLQWEVALDASFSTLVKSGTVTAEPAHDSTVKVDVTGLQPATSYFYRFRNGAVVSETGRTRTLPTGSVQQVKLGVFSCAAYSIGQFHVYNHASNRTDLDAALMLGDYIYETGLTDAEQLAAGALGRQADPQGELHTLNEYRLRYQRYHTDADLRALRRNMPLIAVWDDHELVNDIWRDGAGGHDPATEGSFAARRAAAVQAYHEWMPTRTGADPLRIYRSFDFGNLLSLHMLDTRVVGRDAPTNRDAYLAGAADDPARQLLGTEQEAWLAARLQESGATWQVLGQQLVFGGMRIPLSVFDDFSEDAINAFLAALDTPEASRTDAQRALVAQPRIGYELGNWDGYPAARERVLAMASASDRNLVVLSGDSHNAWAHDLRDTAGRRIGVEFATPSVTSTGLEIAHPRIGRQFLADSFLRMVPDLKYADTARRGYVAVSFTPASVTGEFVFVGSVFGNSFSVAVGPSLQALAGPAGRELHSV